MIPIKNKFSWKGIEKNNFFCVGVWIQEISLSSDIDNVSVNDHTTKVLIIKTTKIANKGRPNCVG